MNNKIFWIPSYPKSGNTWLRMILAGLFFSENGRIDFSYLLKINKFDKLSNFYFIKDLSLKSFELIFNKNKEYNEESLIEYSKYWIKAQKRIKSDNKLIFFKTHNARVTIEKNKYTNQSTTNGFIYISRDPRDVAISYAKHMNKSLDFTIDYLINGQIMGKDQIDENMPEITLNWENHFLSWQKFTEVPSLYIRYEDLLDNTEKEIIKIADFFCKNFNLQIKNRNQKIKNILNSTNFKHLKKKESKFGFKEARGNDGFFRVGKKQQWKKILNQNQINLINSSFKDTMKNLKYI